MPVDKTINESQPTPTLETMPFFIGVRWMKPMPEISTKLCNELMRFTAKRWDAYAFLMRNLFNCKNTNDAFRHQANFLQDYWQDCYDESVALIRIAHED